MAWGAGLAKSRAELAAENKSLRAANRAQSIAHVLNTFIRYAGLVLIARYIYLSVDSLAGKQTDAVVSFFGNVTVSITLAWTLTISAVIWALVERRLRRDVIQRFEGRNRALEESCDPRRSSSKLTPRGGTRPEDKK